MFLRKVFVRPSPRNINPTHATQQNSKTTNKISFSPSHMSLKPSTLRKLGSNRLELRYKVDTL